MTKKKKILVAIPLIILLLVVVLRLLGFWVHVSSTTGKIFFQYPSNWKFITELRRKNSTRVTIRKVEEDKKIPAGSVFKISDSSPLGKFLDFKTGRYPKFDLKKWNWETDYIIAQVEDFDPEKSTVTLNVRFPSDKPFSSFSSSDFLKTTINCVEELTYLSDGTGEKMIKEGINFFDTVKVGKYILYTKCLNEVCSEVGEICVINPIKEM